MDTNYSQQQIIHPISKAEVSTTELQPGIFLIKEKVPTLNEYERYLFLKVEVRKASMIEFEADFTGSKNIYIEGTNALITTTLIPPFSSKIVAKILLKLDFNLKNQFKITYKPPPVILQKKFIQESVSNLNNHILRIKALMTRLPIQLLPVNEAVNILYRNKVNFVDLEFMPIEKSVFGLRKDEQKEQDLDIVVHWRRPIEYITGQQNEPGLISLFSESIEPNDINQGALSDGWFLSAVACLAEYPGMIERLFLTKTYNDQGIYRMRFCVNGEWMHATIDDYIPCYTMGAPIFSSNQNPQELWVTLLEKAYAKLKGNYMCLKGGFVYQGLIDLTGCPTFMYNFQDQRTMNQIQSGEFWNLLKLNSQNGYILAASVEGEGATGEESLSTQVATLPAENTTNINNNYNFNYNFNKQQQQNVTNQTPNQLLQGFSYSIVQVREYITTLQNIKLVNIRNPWAPFQWLGDWSDNSVLWTNEIRNALKPALVENDGTFWMAYHDFLTHFRSVSVCKTKAWEELRIKGKFLRTRDMETSKDEQVISKWYYTIEVKQQTSTVIGIHQEDARSPFCSRYRAPIDVGFALFQKLPNGENVLIDMKGFAFKNPLQKEITLPPGTYILLPRTTGCTLQRPDDADLTKISLLMPNGSLHPLLESTIKDIFKKYDMLLNRELAFGEFSHFCQTISIGISEHEFSNKILVSYNSTDTGITLQGFLDYFKNCIALYGEDTIWEWMYNLGYDSDLYSVRSRCFILSIHSSVKLTVMVKDNLMSDFDNQANIILISKFGKELEKTQQGVKAFFQFHKNAYAYSYAIKNEQLIPVECTIDCKNSNNMLFSTRTNVISKIIEPNEWCFFLHTCAKPSAENYRRSATITWTQAITLLEGYDAF